MLAASAPCHSSLPGLSRRSRRPRGLHTAATPGTAACPLRSAAPKDPANDRAYHMGWLLLRPAELLFPAIAHRALLCWQHQGRVLHSFRLWSRPPVIVQCTRSAYFNVLPKVLTVCGMLMPSFVEASLCACFVHGHCWGLLRRLMLPRAVPLARPKVVRYGCQTAS